MLTENIVKVFFYAIIGQQAVNKKINTPTGY